MSTLYDDQSGRSSLIPSFLRSPGYADGRALSSRNHKKFHLQTTLDLSFHNFKNFQKRSHFFKTPPSPMTHHQHSAPSGIKSTVLPSAGPRGAGRLRPSLTGPCATDPGWGFREVRSCLLFFKQTKVILKKGTDGHFINRK